MQIQKQDEQAWTNVATVVAAEHSLGTRAAVMLRGLLSGQKYNVRAISFTNSGAYNGLDTFGTFTAR